MSSWNMNVWVCAILNRTVRDSEDDYRTQVVKTSVPVNDSLIQDCVHPDYDIPPIYGSCHKQR